MLKRLCLIAALAVSHCWGTITFANHYAQKSTDSNGFTTTAYDSTAGSCNFLVVLVVSYAGATEPTLTDNQSNTWQPLTPYTNSGNGRVHIRYAFNPTLSASHTFTLNGVATYPAIFIAGFSGMLTTSSVFQSGTDSGANLTGTTIQPGSITPGNSPALVVSGVVAGSAQTFSINSGFTISDQLILVGGQSYGGGFAYLIQSSAAAVNPTWTVGSSAALTTDIAAFQGTGGAAASSAASKMKKLQKYGEVPF